MVYYWIQFEIWDKARTNFQNRKKEGFTISSEGEYIAEYDGAIDAENATGIKRQNISKVILGKRHTAGGYIWKKGGSKWKVE